MRKFLKKFLSQSSKEKIGLFITVYYSEFLVKCILFRAKKIIRKIFPDKNKTGIRYYKNCAKKNRCFIVGTGPSLRMSDLDKLVDDDSFSCNSIIYSFSNVSWRPKYYFILDERVYKNIRDDIINSKLDVSFYSDVLSNYPLKGYSMLVDYRQEFRRRKGIKPFYSVSDDVSVFVGDGNTVVYAMIQFAIYMGYKEIYLLGVDCNYNKDHTNHFIEYNSGHKEVSSFGSSMIQAFAFLNEYLNKNNPDVRIYNATRGGMLDVFPRVDFDELFIKE